jgi:CheY-like chemotaxis protein
VNIQTGLSVIEGVTIMKLFKVLVVDDDDNLSFLIGERLGNEGYEVRSAESVAAGYLTYLRFRPDLVLTDISMGEETGIELVERIRIHEPEIATIYMTGDPDRYRSELKVENTVHHTRVLRKPFSENNLLDLIAAHAHGPLHSTT